MPASITERRKQRDAKDPSPNSFLGFQLVERRKRAFALHKIGHSLDDTARALDISPAQAWHDVVWVERHGGGATDGELLGSSVIDKDWASRKLWTELELIKGEALRGWARSQAGKTTKARKSVSGEKDSRDETTEQVTTSAGDPRFLSVAAGIIHDQALLIGLVQDGKDGRGMAASPVDHDADESETVAIIEVTSRDQARALTGKRYCRVADVSSEVVDGSADPPENDRSSS